MEKIFGHHTHDVVDLRVSQGSLAGPDAYSLGEAADIARRAHPDALRWLRRVSPQGVAVTRRAVRAGRRAEAWRELGCLALSHYTDGVAHYALTDKGRAVLSASHAVRTYSAGSSQTLIG